MKRSLSGRSSRCLPTAASGWYWMPKVHFLSVLSTYSMIGMPSVSVVPVTTRPVFSTLMTA